MRYDIGIHIFFVLSTLQAAWLLSILKIVWIGYYLKFHSLKLRFKMSEMIGEHDLLISATVGDDVEPSYDCKFRDVHN